MFISLFFIHLIFDSIEGNVKANGGENPMNWFRLYARKEDNTGWWYYRVLKFMDLRLIFY